MKPRQMRRCQPMPRSDSVKTSIKIASKTPIAMLTIRFVVAGMAGMLLTMAMTPTSRTIVTTSSMTVIPSIYDKAAAQSMRSIALDRRQ